MKEVMCKLYLSFLSLRTVNTVTHSLGTLDFIPHIYWLITDRTLDVVCKSLQFFFAASSAKFHIQISQWTYVLNKLH